MEERNNNQGLTITIAECSPGYRVTVWENRGDRASQIDSALAPTPHDLKYYLEKTGRDFPDRKVDYHAMTPDKHNFFHVYQRATGQDLEKYLDS